MKDGPVLGCAAYIVYMIWSVFQLLAMVKGVQIMFHLPLPLAVAACFIVAWIPILGTIAGIKGAMVGWGWGLWTAIAFFFAPYVLYTLAVVTGAAADLWTRHKGKSV